jgi:NADH pyrophosphatase NudC (nudix superfamily)
MINQEIKQFSSNSEMESFLKTEHRKVFADWIHKIVKIYPELAIAQPQITVGAYKKGNEVYIVRYNLDKTAMYSLKLVEAPSDRLNTKGETVQFEFKYAPEAMKFLTTADKMPVEEAQRLTIMYKRCIICGHRLKTKQSLERGIGPVCAKNQAKTTNTGLTKKQYLEELSKKNAKRMKVGDV